MQKDRITLIVMCYQHAEFLEDCLDSVLALMPMPGEIVIHDDCSSDGSRGKIDQWIERHDVDIRRIYPSRNVGLCAGLNTCINVATGEYVGFVSADDTLRPDHIAVLGEAMRGASSEVAVTYGDAALMDQAGIQLGRSFIEEYRGGSAPEGDVFLDLLLNGSIPAMAALLRRSSLLEVGGYDEKLYFEDWDMWLRLADRFKYKHVDSTVSNYRIVPGSMSRSAGERAALSFFRTCEKWYGRDAETKAIVRAKLRKYARQLYGFGAGVGRPELWRNVRYNPGLATLGWAVGSSLGVSIETWDRAATFGFAGRVDR